MIEGDRVRLLRTTTQLTVCNLKVGSLGTVYEYHGLLGVQFDDYRPGSNMVCFHTFMGRTVVPIVDLCEKLPATEAVQS